MSSAMLDAKEGCLDTPAMLPATGKRVSGNALNFYYLHKLA